MLPDSARLQEEDAEYLNRKRLSKHQPALPLYTERDANAALRQVKPVRYDEEVRLNKFMTARFISAGHILGSSFVELTITEEERPIRRTDPERSEPGLRSRLPSCRIDLRGPAARPIGSEGSAG
jgi:Cft2 family RNA processing exonuclease